MAVTSRALKLPVFKVRLLRDLNLGLPRESLNIGKSTVWKREVKSAGGVSVHDILSSMYLGLLHKTSNGCISKSLSVQDK